MFNPIKRLAGALRRQIVWQQVSYSTKPLLIHYTPDFSGGAGNNIAAIADALPEYSHLIVSYRPIRAPATLMLVGHKNLYWIQGRITANNLMEFQNLKPEAFFNHLSWDLVPLDRRWFSIASRPGVVSFAHAHGSIKDIDLNHADRTVVFSRYLEDPQLEAVFNPERDRRACSIPNCFNEKTLIALPLQGRLRGGEFIIGNITNGAAWKHSADFLELCVSIASAIPNVRFRFLGTRDLISQLANNSLKIEILLPFSTPVENYLQNVSVLIHKTRSDVVETWCRTVTEAMFACVPVVAEKKGGIRSQICDGVTGFLCADNPDFVSSIKLLYEDQTVYERICQQARDYALSNFGLENSRKLLLALLKSCK